MDAAPIPPPPPEDAPSEPSSVTDSLTNIIISPGEVFEEIKPAPVRASNWVVPLILSCIATVVYICIAFSQPGILRAMQEQRQYAMQKKVAAGKLTQAQADQATAVTERFVTPTILKIFGAGAAILGSVGGLAAPFPGIVLDGTNVLVPLFGSASANGGVAKVSIASPATPMIEGTVALSSPVSGGLANAEYLAVKASKMGHKL